MPNPTFEQFTAAQFAERSVDVSEVRPEARVITESEFHYALRDAWLEGQKASSPRA